MCFPQDSLLWSGVPYGCEVIAYLRILLGLLLHLCTSPLYEMHHDGRKWASIKATIFVSLRRPALTRAHYLTMSFILRDPFFDGFEDVMTWPLRGRDHSPFALEDDKSMAKRVRRDVITPFSGFGRMDMTESEQCLPAVRGHPWNGEEGYQDLHPEQRAGD